MEFGIEECAILIRKKEKTKEIEQHNQKITKTLGKKQNYKKLRILKVGTMKHIEMKEK